MSKKYVLFFLLVFFSFIPVYAQAGNIVNDLSIGVGYPYLGIKYSPSKKISLEARGAFDEYVQIYGARAYYGFNPVSKIYPLAGLELDYVVFDDGFVDGKGFIAYPFTGGEYFLIDSLSLVMDFGPAFISLKESDFDLTTGGFEWVVNLGMYFYFR